MRCARNDVCDGQTRQAVRGGLPSAPAVIWESSNDAAGRADAGGAAVEPATSVSIVWACDDGLLSMERRFGMAGMTASRDRTPPPSGLLRMITTVPEMRS